jgi:hypothetical protein
MENTTAMELNKEAQNKKYIPEIDMQNITLFITKLLIRAGFAYDKIYCTVNCRLWVRKEISQKV